jgi:hypothetical protein
MNYTHSIKMTPFFLKGTVTTSKLKMADENFSDAAIFISQNSLIIYT